MKIVLFLSHWMALPSLEVIASFKFLVGIVVPARNDEVTAKVRDIASVLKVPLFELDETSNQNDLTAWLERVGPDACFVITFPHKIAPSVLSIPRAGFFNFHCGLLPKYRGIDPIFWQIRNGEASGGISVLRMDAGFDTGEVLLEEKLAILPSDTYGLHLNKLAMITVNPVKLLIDRLLTGTVSRAAAGASRPSEPILKRPQMEDLVIRWKEQGAEEIRAIVRAANPAYKGAIVFIRGVPFHLIEVSISDSSAGQNRRVLPGTIISGGVGGGLRIRTADDKDLTALIIGSQDGIFTGEAFVTNYELREGEMLGQ